MKDGKFESYAELDAYFGQRLLPCLICSKEIQNLGYHCYKTHGMQYGDYHRLFGIPLKYGLLGSELKEKQRLQSGHRMASLSPEEMSKRVQEMINKNPLSGLPKPFAPVEKRMKAIVAAGNREKIPALHLMACAAKCSSCDTEFTSNRMAVLAHSKLFCIKCRYENHSAAEKVWLSKNPGKAAEYRRRYREKRRTA